MGMLPLGKITFRLFLVIKNEKNQSLKKEGKE